MSDLVTSSPLPSRHAVRVLLEDLTGRPIELVDAEPPAPKSTNVVAVYVTDQLKMSAVAVLDLEGAAWLAGALGMIPKGGVQEAIDERDLQGMLLDCAHEVLNVLSAVFNVGQAPHVRLYQMYGPNDVVPGDAASLAAAVGARMDVSLSIGGYGSGLMSVVVR
jgi:hypothetical protein